VFTCYLDNTLPFAYSDALRARQGNASPSLFNGQGTNQVFFRSGSLWLAFTDGGAGYDTIDWLEVRPRLTTQATHNPQWVDAPALMDYGNVSLTANIDLYQPSIIPSQEGDAALIFNYSGTSSYPRIAYTGRRSSDPAHTMGQGTVVALPGGAGTSANLGSWGIYNGCAMQLNSVTRGTLWCAAAYQVSSTNSIWNTRLAQLRLE
jgi:hypothetical protein